MSAVEPDGGKAAVRTGMQIDNIPFGTIFLLELVSDRGALPSEFGEGLEVHFGRRAGSGVWLMRLGEHIAKALLRPREAHRVRTLRQLVDSAWPKLAVIVKRPDDETLVVRVHEFTYRQSWPSGRSVRIGLPPTLLRPLARLCGEERLTLEEGIDILGGEFVLEPAADDEPFRLFLAAGAATAEQRFRLHGPNLTLDVRQDEQRRLVVLSVGGAAAPDGRLSLVEIDAVAFVPEKDVEPLAPVAHALLTRLFSGTERYLRLWNQYNELDRQRLDDEALKIGYLRYSSWQAIAGEDFGCRFKLVDDDDDEDRKANLSALRDAAGKAAVLLQAAAAPPAFLIEGENREEEEEPPRSRRRRRQRVMVGQCRPQDIDPAGRWIELRTFDDEVSDDPPAHGYLYLSQVGSRIAMERREIAQAGIRSGACPMPQLGLILENQPLPLPPETVRKEDHISSLVRAVFEKGPTPFQEEAVNIAINTPDIAVIQGPPGTGKTEVISAIVKRLEELADPGENPAGLFLITSFQHVAVENVAARIQPFGLPPLKVGRRKTPRDEASQAAPIAAWLEKTIGYVQGHDAYSSNVAAVDTLRATQLQLQAYALGHHRLDETADMLDRIVIATSDLVPADIQERGRLTAQKLRSDHRDQMRGPSPEEDAAYRAAYGLRYQRGTFLDDGPLVAAKLLAAIAKLPGGGGLCSPEDLSLLEGIGRMDRDGRAGVPTADDLRAFAALRERLLLKLTPEKRPLSVRAAPRADVGIVLSDIVKAVRDRVYASGAGVPLILNDYQLELKQSSWRFEGALKRYTAAIAETCQGSARSLRSALQANLNSRGYETVIIDEAARANPLDLLIPMAQARRRIILVGDHKQLPHSLEPELEEDVKATFDEEEQQALQMSLFERLFKDLKEREEKDGEPRRTVTLETQFRMPELLGSFVSTQFYEGQLNSPDTSHFRHGLQRYSRDGREYVAAWINVPARDASKADRERRGATTRSISRRVEAEAIRFAIKDILEDKPDASIGVISFYADQVALLQDVLEPLCKEQRRHDRKPVEVGSVDAFQGKQYPIVFLSMTRCNALEFKDLPADMEPRAARLEMERRMRSRYGHLVLANRMCVALSRQRNLMIVVGDLGMLTYPEAATAIGPLKAFNELCKERGMHFEWSPGDLRLVSVGKDPSA